VGPTTLGDFEIFQNQAHILFWPCFQNTNFGDRINYEISQKWQGLAQHHYHPL
jgi:hypothetical protein